MALSNYDMLVRADRFFRRMCVSCGKRAAQIGKNDFLPDPTHCPSCAMKPHSFTPDPVREERRSGAASLYMVGGDA